MWSLPTIIIIGSRDFLPRVILVVVQSFKMGCTLTVTWILTRVRCRIVIILITWFLCRFYLVTFVTKDNHLLLTICCGGSHAPHGKAARASMVGSKCQRSGKPNSRSWSCTTISATAEGCQPSPQSTQPPPPLAQPLSPELGESLAAALNKQLGPPYWRIYLVPVAQICRRSSLRFRFCCLWMLQQIVPWSRAPARLVLTSLPPRPRSTGRAMDSRAELLLQ